MTLYKTDQDGLMKDTNGGFVFVDLEDKVSSYRTERSRQLLMIDQERKINNLQEEVKSIKDILNKILEKVS